MSGAAGGNARRGLRMGVLVGALLVVSLGLARWPQGRDGPPAQAWSDAAPAAGHPAVVRPPGDERPRAGASAACPAGDAARTDAAQRAQPEARGRAARPA